jgi:uncharacterized protein (DUF1697 family)
MTMTRYVAFLRAINVGGHVVKMEVLRALFESIKLKQVETFIASGNVIFETNSQDVAAIREKIEKSLHKALGYEVVTLLRTDQEVAAIARYTPFPESEVASALTFCVGFLSAPLTAEAAQRVLSLKDEMNDFHFHGSELYWLGRQKQSELTFTNAVFEKAAGVRGTFRGMSTIRKLAAKYPPSLL